MRPKLIQGVPGLNPEASPFARLEQFARLIVRIPKSEADKDIGRPSSVRPRVAPKKAKERVHD